MASPGSTVSSGKDAASWSKDDRYEHALNWVIENVEELCDEFSKASGTDGKECMHLELSTAKVLDELEMPTIEHAKQEVMLLTRLHNALSTLVEQCEKVLSSSEVIDRLKAFRDEMQKLFSLSPVCVVPGKGGRKKMEIAIDREFSNKQRSSKEESSILAPERTPTPAPEARKPDHAKDRTDRVTELDESALRKLDKNFSAKKSTKNETSSTDTMATRTPNPAGDAEEPEERSQRIWMEEDLLKSPLFKGRGGGRQSSTVSKPRTKTEDTDPVPTKATGDDRVDLIPKRNSDEPSIIKDDTQRQPEPSLMKVQRLPEMSSATEARQEEDEGNSFSRKVIAAVAIVVLPFVFLWLILFALEWNHRCVAGRRMIGWELACNVANVFCEHYNVMCIKYCSSGMQRDKWQCSR